MKRLCLLRTALLCALCAAAPKAAAFPLTDGTFSQPLAQAVRSGTISEVLVTTHPVPWMDLDKLLLAGKFKPGEMHPDALTTRGPAPGNVFVILTFEVGKGLSLGRYDYQLTVGNNTSNIEAIARPDSAFDPRVWEIRADDVVEEVRALFEVPMPSAPVTGLLKDSLNTSIREQAVSLPIGRKDSATPALPVLPAVVPEGDPAAGENTGDDKARLEGKADQGREEGKNRGPGKPGPRNGQAKGRDGKPNSQPRKPDSKAGDGLDNLWN